MQLFTFMLIILNPFAQVLYLSDLMRQMTSREFAAVHVRATLLSFGVFALFVLFGDMLLHDVFQVRLASLQIFGGLIILYVAYRYVTIGPGSNVLFKGSITDLAPNISLPYMIGPGTIWTSILIGRQFPWAIALAVVAAVLAINMVFVIAVQLTFDKLQARRETLIGKYFAILMRTNALFIGAIAVEMILRGIDQAFVDVAS